MELKKENKVTRCFSGQEGRQAKNQELSRNGCVATAGPAKSGSADRENSQTEEEIGAEVAWARLFASLAPAYLADGLCYRTG